MVNTCGMCGGGLPERPPGVCGKPRRYCSTACSVRAQRERDRRRRYIGRLVERRAALGDAAAALLLAEVGGR